MSRRGEVIGFLRESDTPRDVAGIAAALGVHANTVRFHLDRLVDDGLVERASEPAAGPGRPRQVFRAVPAMDPSGPRHYRLLADVLVAGLADRPRPAGAALAAGRAWGRRIGAATSPDAGAADPVGRLTDVLAELDFAPEPRADDAGPVIDLRHCPFLELAEERADVVCPVHLGLMRGVLEAWGPDVTVERLDPFVAPDLCTAHLARRETP